MSNNIFLLIAVITGLCIITACDKDKPEFDGVVCGTADPLNDLEWLHEEYVKIKDFNPQLHGIVVFRFDGMTIIDMQYSASSSLSNSQFKCDGTKIDFNSNIEKRDYFNDYWENRKEITVLFGTRWW